MGCKMCVKVEENCLGWYVRHNNEPSLLLESAMQYLVKFHTAKKKVKKEDNQDRIINWRGKAIHGQYVRQIENKYKSKV